MLKEQFEVSISEMMRKAGSPYRCGCRNRTLKGKPRAS